ncbi:MAG: hypothetical protein ACK5N0_00210 [Synechococcaceae cyanobacterium]
MLCVRCGRLAALIAALAQVASVAVERIVFRCGAMAHALALFPRAA